MKMKKTNDEFNYTPYIIGFAIMFGLFLILTPTGMALIVSLFLFIVQLCLVMLFLIAIALPIWLPFALIFFLLTVFRKDS